MKKYYTLLEFDDDLKKWLIVFGDYNLEIVQEEQADIRMGFEVENRRVGQYVWHENPEYNDGERIHYVSYFQIIATGDQQQDIDAKVLELNMKGVK